MSPVEKLGFVWSGVSRVVAGKVGNEGRACAVQEGDCGRRFRLTFKIEFLDFWVLPALTFDGHRFLSLFNYVDFGKKTEFRNHRSSSGEW